MELQPNEQIQDGSNPFRSCLLLRERTCGRGLTLQEILEFEVAFGDSVVNNYWYCEQDSTVANYYEEFNDWKRWTAIYFDEHDSEEVVVFIFIRGLKEEIRNQMPSPTTLFRAYWDAISIELSLKVTSQISAAMSNLFAKFPQENRVVVQESKDDDDEATKLADPNGQSEERHPSQGDFVVEEIESETSLENEGPVKGVCSVPVEGLVLFESDAITDQCLQEETENQGLEKSEKDESIEVMRCKYDHKVIPEFPIDSYALTDNMVDLVGTKVFPLDSMEIVRPVHIHKVLILQDFNSSYEGLMNRFRWSGHDTELQYVTVVSLQVIDDSAKHLESTFCWIPMFLSQVTVYDPGGKGSLVSHFANCYFCNPCPDEIRFPCISSSFAWVIFMHMFQSKEVLLALIIHCTGTCENLRHDQQNPVCILVHPSLHRLLILNDSVALGNLQMIVVQILNCFQSGTATHDSFTLLFTHLHLEDKVSFNGDGSIVIQAQRINNVEVSVIKHVTAMLISELQDHLINLMVMKYIYALCALVNRGCRNTFVTMRDSIENLRMSTRSCWDLISFGVSILLWAAAAFYYVSSNAWKECMIFGGKIFRTVSPTSHDSRLLRLYYLKFNGFTCICESVEAIAIFHRLLHLTDISVFIIQSGWRNFHKWNDKASSSILATRASMAATQLATIADFALQEFFSSSTLSHGECSH